MTAATFVVLMVPPKEINPNARVHFQVRAGAARGFRLAAKMAAVDALNTPGHAITSFCGYHLPVALDVEIGWPGKRSGLDHDNAIASLKPLIDGLSDALWTSRDGHVRIGRVTQTRGDGTVTVTLRNDTLNGESP